jgi:ammonium transporter, Amt family
MSAAEEALKSLEEAVDHGWLMFGGVLVFFMQAGFALLEGGMVRPKNTQSIMMKNLLDMTVGALGWYAFGFAIAYGEDNANANAVTRNGIEGYDGFIGTTGFFSKDKHVKKIDSFAGWFFQFTFCATAATIVSGALAERAKFEGFAIISFWLSVFVYPVVVHWTWGLGWLYMENYTDFAGSGIVHLTGGTAALVGAIIMGPRIGRFAPVADHEDGAPAEPKIGEGPTSIAQVTLGTLVLWTGWYGFNGASSLGLSGGGSNVAGRAMLNSTISAAAGGVTTMLMSRYVLKPRTHFDIVAICNGILAGLVGVTAGCDSMRSFAALFTGIIASFVYLSAERALAKAKIDDVIGAFPVHGACGIWGVLATGLFHMEKGLFYSEEFTRSEGKGCFGPNLIGICVIPLWVATTTIPLFLGLKKVNLLRVSKEAEEEGMDKHYFQVISEDTKRLTHIDMADVMVAAAPQEPVAKDV